MTAIRSILPPSLLSICLDRRTHVPDATIIVTPEAVIHIYEQYVYMSFNLARRPHGAKHHPPR